jgi:hypothetical protein
MKPKLMGRRYATCRRHASVALDHMIARPVFVWNADDQPDKRCHCGNQARFFLIELDTNPEETEK